MMAQATNLGFPTICPPLYPTAAELIAEVVRRECEVIARLIEADPHQWSSRPCQTCRAISATLGRPFGCSARESR
jgi:hypothetical protein